MNILEILNKLESKGKDKDEILLWRSLIPAMTEEEIKELAENLKRELELIGSED